ncbi:hypothetical protein K7W03_25575 [Sphingobium sp. PNB]|jgi:hypothetical protein|uniref:DUF7713 domain-containing protein n=1 Tax=Sphingobium sp. PNB TaxID=863934 RepID=UPI001CA38B04|nr:hypothetical protein [Sphingobium sp. PNB]MCB4862957.1 hypothetical protein [Sphingobium sp. PNB]
MTQVQCHACHARVASYDLIHFGSMETGYRDLCSRCFNAEVARTGQIELEQVGFQPIDMSDAAGVKRRFHFLLLHLGDRVTLEAFEVQDSERRGYEFQILDDAQADLFELMARLVERMRRALSLRHLVDDGQRCSIADMTVRGRIGCDLESDDRVPMLVIDGREVSWEQFGQMLMTFEGWQFKPCLSG